MATTAATTKAYLLKKGEVSLQFVGNPPTKSSDRAPIYTADLKSFTCFPDEIYDAQQIKLVSEAIKNASELGENQPIIEMYGKYDTFYERPRIYTKVSFPQELVSTLSGILPEATIRIKGTYKAVQPPQAGVSSSFDPPDLYPIVTMLSQRPLEFYRQGPVPVSSYREIAQQLIQRMTRPREPNSLRNMRPESDFHPRDLASRHVSNESFWTPVDNLEHEFSVEGLELTENATYQSFHGIEKLEEYYKLGGVTHAMITFSVVLEWIEFEGPNPAFETSILETLYEDKPLADCIIESSNKKEFECHQNILGVNSEVLLKMLESGMQENQTKRIKLEDMSGKSVKMMLEYMYRRELKLEGHTEEEILQLLKAARKFNISRLEVMVSRFLLYTPMEWFTMDGVLAFYFYAKNVDMLGNLVEKLKVVMKANSQELSASTTYKEWVKRDPKVASEFVLQLLKPEQGNANVAVETGERNAEDRIIDVVDEDENE